MPNSPTPPIGITSTASTGADRSTLQQATSSSISIARDTRRRARAADRQRLTTARGAGSDTEQPTVPGTDGSLGRPENRRENCRNYSTAGRRAAATASTSRVSSARPSVSGRRLGSMAAAARTAWGSGTRPFSVVGQCLSPLTEDALDHTLEAGSGRRPAHRPVRMRDARPPNGTLGAGRNAPGGRSRSRVTRACRPERGSSGRRIPCAPASRRADRPLRAAA